MKTPFSILLTGMPNSGKSTIAYHLVQGHLRNTFVIDGDRHRQAQFLGEQLGFEKEDIMRNNKHVVALALFAQEQGFNLLTPQIAPYLDQRQEFKVLKNHIEVYCRCPLEARSKRDNFRDSEIVYEEGYPNLILDTNDMSIDECVKAVMKSLEKL